jgi:hypothetical protein
MAEELVGKVGWLVGASSLPSGGECGVELLAGWKRRLLVRMCLLVWTWPLMAKLLFKPSRSQTA